MASLPIYDIAGNEVGTYEVDPDQIAPRISKQLLHDAVVMYQANLRQGTHKTKTRGEVRGTTKKMYRQKGTGNARAGSRRTNIRRGGGHGHAKQPRNYGYRLPKKAVKLATRMAIASKIKDEQVVIVDALAFDQPKTSQLAGALRALGLEGVSTLVATDGIDLNVYKSGRNIDRVSVMPVSDLNALAVLKPRRMVITRDAMDRIKEGTFNSNASESQETTAA